MSLVNSKGHRIFVLVEDDEVELWGLSQAEKGPAVVEVVVTDVLDQLLFTNSEGGVGVCDYREEHEGDRYYLMHAYNYCKRYMLVYFQRFLRVDGF